VSEETAILVEGTEGLEGNQLDHIQDIAWRGACVVLYHEMLEGVFGTGDIAFLHPPLL
jgi:hypothetical protein